MTTHMPRAYVTEKHSGAGEHDLRLGVVVSGAGKRVAGRYSLELAA